MEQWKKLEGYDNHQYGGYFVSNYGRVKNGQGKLLFLCITKKGYNRVQLYKDCKKKIPYVHRLVGKAFIPNPKNLPQINHKDTNKRNNHVSNLEWCTNKQNSDHAVLHGLKIGLKGEKNPRATVTLKEAKEIRAAVLSKTFLRAQLAEKYGVSVHVVKDIRHGKTWNYA